jgi:hypothetical protein
MVATIEACPAQATNTRSLSRVVAIVKVAVWRPNLLKTTRSSLWRFHPSGCCSSRSADGKEGLVAALVQADKVMSITAVTKNMGRFRNRSSCLCAKSNTLTTASSLTIGLQAGEG